MEPWEREDFILLTEKALDEADQDRFVEFLMKRESCIGHLLEKDPWVLEGKIEKCLFYETLILRRLEVERKKVIEKMDKLSKSVKAIRIYTPKFPLPPVSVLFGKEG
jgi:hypothetical protein